MSTLRTLCFEDLSVSSEQLTKIVPSSDTVGFVEVTGDRNPIHLSEHFAAKTPFGASGSASNHTVLALSVLDHVLVEHQVDAAYFASIAVTSTSIIMYGQASWGTFSKVDAGIGASPNASLRHFSAS
jgi:acyl dehydratase